MLKNNVQVILWLVFLTWIGVPLAVHANVPAAHIAAMSGDVTAVDPESLVRELQRGDEVFAGETIVTGANGRVRLAFTDGGAMTLRPASRLIIDTYHYSGDVEQDSQATRLLRGGLRAVTGAIGENRNESYTLDTPVATMGIRGTEFLLRFCQNDCQDMGYLNVKESPDGLYTFTLSGTTIVGSIQVGEGESSYTDMDGTTVLLFVPPEILLLDPALDTEFTEDDEEGLFLFDIPVQSHGTRIIECR